MNDPDSPPTIAEAIYQLAKVIDRLGEGTVHNPGVIEHISMCIKDGCREIASALDHAEAIQNVADALNRIADTFEDVNENKA